MREFDTGATRDRDETKLDFEGFLHPLVIKRFAEFMHKHRYQADGKLRDSDNWQKGIPLDAYMKSNWRHFHDLWSYHRHEEIKDDIEEVLCAIMFNTMGYLLETMKERKAEKHFSVQLPVDYPIRLDSNRVECNCDKCRPIAPEDLQSALNSAKPGDTIWLEKDKVYSGNWTLPGNAFRAGCDCNDCTAIRRSVDAKAP